MLKIEDVKLLIVHCSDTPNTEDIGISEIHQMHLKFGWDGIGYHKVIRRSGQIENGRPECWIGAHVKGKNNISLGVCLIGRNLFSDQQFVSLEKLLLQWKQKYKGAIILGHKDATETKKTCPNFDVNNWCLERKLI